MEVWGLVLLSLSLFLPFALVLRRRGRSGSQKALPPGPPVFPVVGNLFWLRHSISDTGGVLRPLRRRYGSLLTIHVGSRRTILVFDRDLAHKVLVQSGSIFADRPPGGLISVAAGHSRISINSSPYGHLWRVLRRNLTKEILHPSRVGLFSQARDETLRVLLGELRRQAVTGEPVVVVECLQYAMFCLLVFMCFGEILDEKDIRNVEKAQRDFLLHINKVNVLAVLPRIACFLFRNRIRKFRDLLRKKRDILIPLIKARRELRDQAHENRRENCFQCSYVDSLFDLQVCDDESGLNKKLTDVDIASLCSEFLDAGTETTSTSLQWIMANLVKHQRIQANLYDEITTVLGEARGMREEDLGKLPYLKAVVMEGLRRHPPGHFLLSHAAMDDTTLNGHLIPKNRTSLNFAVTEINWDAEVWKDPLEFRPERFLPGGEGEDVDITGTKEIKMLPFGAGRRICPGLALAIFHLEYFVANLVTAFEWKPADGVDVDLTEKREFTVAMKNPLTAHISPRRR